MILSSVNWHPAVTLSVRGNGEYNFLNQLFDADLSQLRVEITAVNPLAQNTIQPAILAVIYQENIPDDIFNVAVGIKKPIATLITNLKGYPFKLRIANPNKSQLRLLLQKPKINLPSPMSPLSNPSENEGMTLQLQALIDATNANATAISTLAATTASLPESIVEASNEDQLVDVDEDTITVGTTPTPIRPQNDARRGLTITNNSSNRNARLWLQDDSLPSSTAYNTTGWKVQINKNGGLYEVPQSLVTSAVYAISDGSNGSISYVESVERV